jgi:hypothetical protein
MRSRVKRRCSERREVEQHRVHARVRVHESALPPVVESALRSPGRPLDPGTQAAMEEKLGHRLDEVRVHTGTEADRAATLLEADAFTSGPDLVFAAHRYRPETDEGRRLLAHELVHALQQGLGSSERTALQVGDVAVPNNDPLEREADLAADEIAAGLRLPPGFVTVAAPSAQRRIARQATPERARQTVTEVPESPEAVEAVTEQIERLLVFDPSDLFGRVRRRLARLPSATRRTVLGQVQGRVSATAQATLSTILAELEPGAVGAEALEGLREEGVPEPQVTEAPPAPAEAAPAEGEALEESPAAGLDAEGPEAGFSVPPPTSEPESTRAGTPPPLSGGEPEAAAPEAAAAPPEPETPERAAAPAASAPPAVAEAEGPDESTLQTAPVDEAEAGLTDALDDLETEHAATEEEPRPADVVPVEAAADPEVRDELPPPSGAVDTGPETLPEEASPPEPPGSAPSAVVEDEAQTLTEEGEPESDAVPAMPTAEGVEEGIGPEAESEAPTAEAETDAEAPAGEEVDVEPPEAATDEGGDADAPLATSGDGDVAVPIETPPEPEVADLSGQDPVAAVDAAAALPPAQSQAALPGVTAASSRSVGEKRADLAANPPQLERPSGAPSPEERLAEEAALPPAAAALTRVERAPAAPAAPPVAIAPLPAPGAPVTQAIAAPVIPGGPQGEITQDDARALQRSLQGLPKTDPELHREAGPPPALVLQGDADPGRAHEQRARLQEAARGAQVEGERDVVTPMGETQLYPAVPPETLRATVAPALGEPAAAPAAGASAAAAAGAAQPRASRAVSVIAREERGSDLRAAAGTAKADMVAKQREQEAKAADERKKSEAEVADLVRTNAADQASERRKARLEVHDQRVEWAEGQQQAVDRARTGADAAMATATTDIDRERATGERDAAGHIEQGDHEADSARREGEEKAERERKRGEEESEGFFGWLAKKASDFFDAIKEGIKRAFDAARAAVRAAIDAAKRLAVAAIEKARSAIVAAIKKAGDVLIAIGDTLLADFPGLRDRFRKAIKDRVDRAVARVNEFAETLKVGVQKALDLLGAALDAALGLLEKGLLAAVDVYAQAVQGAIKFAESAIQALAAFAALIDDVAADPLQWLANLGASAKDGVRNHLWAAFKRAVKRWFNEKLEEVLGLGLAVWNLLKKGGISLAKVGSMAWEALKAAIPIALVQILIEKLIAMIIPAAGAILTIIEGLSAAWGTVRRILEAFERFFRFLKAVKLGNAGALFAEAVAAAAIVVIDFVANWLLKRLRKPAGALAKRFKAMAKKLGAKLGKLAQRFGRGKRLPRKKKKAPDPRSKDAKKDARKRDRQRRAIESTRRTLTKLLSRAIPKSVLSLALKGLKAWHRFRRLRVVERGDRFDVEAGFSPDERVLSGVLRKAEAAGRKAFVWNPKINYAKQGGLRGVLDFAQKTKYAINLNALDRGQKAWHGHHTWPVNELGGAGDQPLVGTRGALHNSVLHVWLRGFVTARLKLTRYHSSEIHRRVLDGELEYADVRRALYAFYASKFGMVPREAWARGIEFTYRKLPISDSAVRAKLRKSERRLAKARARERARV